MMQALFYQREHENEQFRVVMREMLRLINDLDPTLRRGQSKSAPRFSKGGETPS